MKILKAKKNRTWKIFQGKQRFAKLDSAATATTITVTKTTAAAWIDQRIGKKHKKLNTSQILKAKK